jgi:hypothetical protein
MLSLCLAPDLHAWISTLEMIPDQQDQVLFALIDNNIITLKALKQHDAQAIVSLPELASLSSQEKMVLKKALLDCKVCMYACVRVHV